MSVRVPRSLKIVAVWALVALLALNTAIAGRGRLFGRKRCRPVCCPPPCCPAPVCTPRCAPACVVPVAPPTTAAESPVPPVPEEVAPSGVSPETFDSRPPAPAAPAAPEAPEAAAPRTPAEEAPAVPPAPEEAPAAPQPPARPAPAPKAPAQPAPAEDDLFGDPAPAKKPAAADEEIPAPAKPAAPKADGDDLFNNVFSEPPAKPVSQPIEDMPAPVKKPEPKPEPKPADDNDPFADNISLPVPSMREWIDDTGSYRIRARLVQVLDGKVKLLKSNGKTTTVPFSRLSDTDLRYVEQIQTHVQTGRPTPLAAR